MTSKTITLTGAEIRAGYSGGANAWLRNDGTDVIYAAAVPGITAGSDGVVSIPAGQSAPVYGAYGTVYLLGTGSVMLVGSDYSTNPFKTSAQSGGSGADEVARAAISAHESNADMHVTAEEKAEWSAVNNPNLLINPDFKINQIGVSGTITDTGYFVDRWKLADGSVTVNSDGTLTLDGTIIQTLENAAGADVTASASAGAASYDDSAKTLTLTASGETISWAKLEVGSVATPFVPPDTATELAKCQRYLWVLKALNMRAGLSTAHATNGVVFYMHSPAALRKTPSVEYDGIALNELSSNTLKTVDGVQVRGCVSNTIKLVITPSTNDLLTAGNLYEIVTNPDETGVLVFDAEI